MSKLTVTIHPDCYSAQIDDDTVVIATALQIKEIMSHVPDDMPVTWQFADPFVNPEGA